MSSFAISTRGLAVLLLAFFVFSRLSVAAATEPADYARMLERFAEKATFFSRADEDIEEYAVLAYGDDPAALVALRAGLASPKARVRQAAAYLLGMHRDEKAVPALLKLLHDQDGGVRAQVAGALIATGDPEVFAPLTELLADQNAEVRGAVVSGLFHFGAPAYMPLVAALQDRDTTVRLAAVNALNYLGDPHAAGPLAVLLSDADEDIRAAAVDALGRFGALDPLLAALPTGDAKLRAGILGAIARQDDPRVTETLRAACQDADGTVRAEAIHRLSWRDSRALGLVYAALQDPEPAVRRNAVARLRSRLLDPETVDRLLPLLNDPDPLVCRDAAYRLADYRHPRIIPALLARLAEPECPYWVRVALVNQNEPHIIPALLPLLAGQGSGDEYSKESIEANQAIELLVMLGTPAVEPLLDALKADNAGLRIGAASALGQIDDPRVLPALLAALPDRDKQVRLAVLKALATLGDARCFDGVLPCLSEKDADIRCAAAQALVFCQDARLLPPLKSMLLSRSPRERTAALDTLAALADPQVVPLLTRALGDRDEDVRQSAMKACSFRGRDARTLEAIFNAATGTDRIAIDDLAAWLQSYPPEVARPVLLRALRAKDVRRRALAAGALASFPATEVTTALLAAMTDPDTTVRTAAQQALSRLADPTMLPGLLILLDHPLYAGGDRQWGLVELLGCCGRGGAEVLLKLYAGMRPGENHDLLIQALEQTGDPRVVDALARELHDDFSLNPDAAAEALAAIGDPRAIPPLLEALPAAQSNKRSFIAEALGKLKAREAVEPLCALLRNGDRSPGIAEALREIGDPRAADALSLLLDTPPDRLTADTSAVIAAAQALQHFGDVRAASPMVSLLKRCLYDGKADRLCDALIDALSALPAEAARNEALAFLQAEGTPQADELLHRFAPGYREEKLLSELRDTAAPFWDLYQIGSALGKMENGNAKAWLTALAHNDSWRARGAAVYALAERHESWAADGLIVLLTDPQMEVRALAFSALARERGETTKATLAWALTHPNPDIRRAAEELRQLTMVFILTESHLLPDIPGVAVSIKLDE